MVDDEANARSSAESRCDGVLGACNVYGMDIHFSSISLLARNGFTFCMDRCLRDRHRILLEGC